MSSVGKVAHALVHRPATAMRLRPVASTALRKLASSQALIEVRSMTAWSGKTSSVTSGMNGPEKLSFATVLMIVGTSNSLAVRASTWTLSTMVLRSWLCTPWNIAGWKSISARAHVDGLIIFWKDISQLRCLKGPSGGCQDRRADRFGALVGSCSVCWFLLDFAETCSE